ncbi:hypothetical protein LEP1GSC040_2434 [Leptospira santarosai str. 2000030832]|nr:hypothetical protein LEP1GSC040_2434 [Leptospira santarosai str. 2000030832]
MERCKIESVVCSNDSRERGEIDIEEPFVDVGIRPDKNHCAL